MNRAVGEIFGRSAATALAACALLLLLPVLAFAAKPAAKPAPKPAANQAKAPDSKPAADDAAWDDGAGGLNVTREAAITFAPTTQPIAISGDEVWDIKSARPLTKLQDAAYDPRGLRAMNTDGSLFAAAISTADDRPKDACEIGVWSTSTGEQLSRFVATARDGALAYLAVAARGTVITASRDGPAGLVELWDARTGKPLRNFKTPDRVEALKTALSPDGRFLAVAYNEKIVVLEIASGRIAAQLRQPKDTNLRDQVPPPAAPAAPPANPPPPNETARAKHNRERVQKKHAQTLAERLASVEKADFYRSTAALRFSPDGKELAGLFSGQRVRVVIWDNKGNVVQEAWVPNRMDTCDGPAVAWVPDRSALLLQGQYLFERKSARVVWRVIPESGAHRFHFVDKDHLMLMPAIWHAGTSTTVEVPWAEINRSVEALSAKPPVPAHIRPGMPVAIKLEIGELRGGDKEQTRKALVGAIAAHLEHQGIAVADDAKTVLHAAYDEKAGETRKVVEGRFANTAKDTGQTAQDVHGHLAMELYAPGAEVPVWEKEVSGMNATLFLNEEVNATTIRNSMLGSMQGGVGFLRIPYFMPVDSKIASLPIVTSAKSGEPVD